MKTLYMRAGNKYYVIHPDGNIERTDMLLPPSGQWKLVGLQPPGKNPFIPAEKITPELINDIGNKLPKYGIVDYDHGTYREWGAILQEIRFYDRPEDTNYYKYSRGRIA